MELQHSAADFEREGIALFAISYDPVSTLAAFSERYGISYPLLSDEGSAVIRRLGLLNVHLAEQAAVYGVALQPRHEGIPYPGVFVLDEQGMIADKRFYQSYRERETGAGILRQAFDVETDVHGPAVAYEAEGIGVRAWLDSDSYRYFQRLYVTVRLDVAPGLHVYGSPIPEGFVPLSATVAPVDGLVVGPMELPAPQAYRLEGLDEQFFVYTGQVTFRLPVTFTKRDAGDLVLQVGMRWQACSEHDCLPPVSATLELPVSAVAPVASALPAPG